ncbi:ABC transporter substrate-binding protein [Dolichospermum circinale]|uniref:ABC transporter substrate-binding protein n=1 Tax=Dolichospermum circinale TaxID=109265 RepID=UPI00232D2738|nr:ABC transporter substrate-binding protein [Dolichospermum circinale]MDB9454376.1 ABC transporter substrate-binding protein [Dolichospermum circinale CS-541/06]MDB9463699.1 ABC transporter substrate-binding protein [Dolichospermum circinale CS-541/04]MDB9549109.1 ABC transporter substrate-binding protein [Dolichospermum circinale CS-1031]
MITSNLHRNPYIIGRPIGYRESLFGRESIFQLVQENLQQSQQLLLLYGQRRIGKSSIILSIPQQLAEVNEFVFVTFDLSFYSQDPWSSILAALAQAIVDNLELETSISPPKTTELELEINIFERQFLPQVYQQLENKNLVLLLDQFDALISQDLESSAIELTKKIFRRLSDITKRNNKLFIVISIGEHLASTLNILKIFEDVPKIEIGLLDKDSTKELITKPAQGVLEYEEEAIKAIFNLSAGHPYCTQIICFAIFSRAREQNSFKITSADVEKIVDTAIEIGEAGLSWFWAVFSIPEQVVFSAIAQAQETGQNYLKLLEIQGIDAKNQLINQARKQLVDNGFLDATGEKIKVELVRRWIIKRYPLQDQIGQFREFEEKKIPNQKEMIQLPEIVENNHTSNIITNHSNSHTDISANISTKRPLIILTAVATTMTIAASILVASYTNFSLPDSKRELKISSSPTPDYAPDNNTISRGDKTLFSNINNRFRDQGIEAFKNGNYQEAVNLFQQAVKANPYDPEVLIYYNNARASQNSSSVSLAVVVPIDSKTNNDNAQEILRGVAQAQDQFNDNQIKNNLNNQGSNGLLLKVVIANDSNNPEEAKQVVQEIVKDDSILGVIGHNSSDVTKAVIPEYEKAGLAIISSTATSNLLKSSVFFRVVDSDEIAGEKLAQYTNSLGFKKVVIFNNPNSTYSQSITKAFTNEFKKMGGKVLPTIDLSDKEFDPREQVSINKFQAEAAILFPDTEHTNATIEIAKANDDNSLSLLGGHTLYSNDTLVKGGKAVEGMILSVPWFRETSQARAFAERSEQEWGGGISWRTATSFDATQAFIQALSKDNTQDNTRNNVLERLQKVELNNNQTSGYPLKFTKGRERQGQSVLVEVKDGKFTMIIP